ncbi:FG-GAP-like repeat-containing protein [Streptomyces sp. NPDC085466]|uniref:FG-GAP-like repeat-containing protein n=1 Tax=Streptomyces sp. NPDC085466 TaxID=3365725 RepID=UPI0037D38004
MIRTRTHARRLAAAAVTVVLAATGGALTALPATAAPLAAQEERETSVPYPKGYAELLGGGTAGFFTTLQYEVSWTSYATGLTKKLPLVPGQGYAIGVSDVVVATADGTASLTEARELTLHDVASGAQPYTVDLDALAEDGEQYLYRGAVGRTLVVAVKKADGTVEGRLVTAGPDGPTWRPVTGLPADHRGFRVEHTTAGSAVLVVVAGPEGAVRYTRSVLDVPSGAVTDDFPRENANNSSPVSVSATHAAWPDPADPSHVAVAARGTGGTGPVRRTAVAAYHPYALLDGWLVHGSITRPSTNTSGGSPLRAERADGTGEPVRVLDTMGWLVPGPDGSLLARGGSVEHGEGLYRITVGADGLPVAELVASTGEPTVLVYGGADVPASIDLDRVKGADFRWKLAGRTLNTRVTITRTDGPRSEEPVVIRDLGPMGSDAVGFRWNGEDFGTPGRPAEAGTYTWTFEADQFNHLNEVRATGTFTVRRTPGPHDFDGNGAPELLVRDAGGRARALDLVPDPAAGVPTAPREAVFGTGWQAFDRLESVGDVAGTRLADVVARDTSGVLWLYQGAGDLAQPLRPRVRVGGGWNAYDRLAGGSDLTGDGRADLVATDKTGVLWLYPATGNAGAPFSARKRIGGGWGIYNEIAATGNIGGAGSGDLVARDTAGVLWLYLGKGDGTFAARTRIGAGWGGFRDLVGIGDADGDGRADLLAGDGYQVSHYRGTGDWKAPFAAGRRTELTTGHDQLF